MCLDTNSIRFASKTDKQITKAYKVVKVSNDKLYTIVKGQEVIPQRWYILPKIIRSGKLPATRIGQFLFNLRDRIKLTEGDEFHQGLYSVFLNVQDAIDYADGSYFTYYEVWEVEIQDIVYTGLQTPTKNRERCLLCGGVFFTKKINTEAWFT
jgi:hypothetical protein